MRDYIKQDEIKTFDSSYKVGLVSTTDDKGDPHITLFSTLMAKAADELMVGNFISGLSTEYMKKRPKCGFLIMTLQRDFWTGRMDYTHMALNGEEYEHFNSMPLFRFNTYFGVDSVYYFKLKEISEKRALNMAGVIANAVRVMLSRGRFKGRGCNGALGAWTCELMQKLDTLAFISYIDDEGYPRVIPCIQLQAADDSTLVLTNHPYKSELSAIPKGARVAVFGANLNFETVLMKGEFSGFEGGLGYVAIDRVYNSSPPKHGYIFPPEERIKR